MGVTTVTDPRLEQGWSVEPWSTHPLGIETTSHITVVVRDLEAATALYTEVLDGVLLHAEEVAGRKRSVFIAVGTNTVIELAEPLSEDGPEGAELSEFGEGIHAVTFRTNDLSRARAFLEEQGMKPQADGDDTIVLGRDQAFGMVMRFSDRTVPNGR
jgi:methylmalonyl-CoA/ethylmalonyl-CoA epimerase